MSDTAKKPLGRPRSTQSHQAILQATLELLAEVGYERTSIDATAARAGVGKTTIYRRYASKEELVAHAIESLREEVHIPDTGTLTGDMDALIPNAAQYVQSPLARQTMAMIISAASSSPQFARIYSTKYLMPRREAFSVVLERAKLRKEIREDIDNGLIFDFVSGIMFHALVFEPTAEPYEVYIRRAVNFLLEGISP
jgi:AcrR family transcriptional regulator